MMNESTEEILQNDNEPLQDSGDDRDALLYDMHDILIQNNQIINEILDNQVIVPTEYYQNVNNYMAMSIILNALLIGVVLAMIFSNFFAGGNHK